jgi:hypothetical protein
MMTSRRHHYGGMGVGEDLADANLRHRWHVMGYDWDDDMGGSHCIVAGRSDVRLYGQMKKNNFGEEEGCHSGKD